MHGIKVVLCSVLLNIHNNVTSLPAITWDAYWLRLNILYIQPPWHSHPKMCNRFSEPPILMFPPLDVCTGEEAPRGCLAGSYGWRWRRGDHTPWLWKTNTVTSPLPALPLTYLTCSLNISTSREYCFTSPWVYLSKFLQKKLQ